MNCSDAKRQQLNSVIAEVALTISTETSANGELRPGEALRQHVIGWVELMRDTVKSRIGFQLIDASFKTQGGVMLEQQRKAQGGVGGRGSSTKRPASAKEAVPGEHDGHSPVPPECGHEHSDKGAECYFLDVGRCSARYAVSASHWRRLVDAGKAPQPRKFGRLVRWSIDDLKVWDDAGNGPIRGLKRQR